MLLKENPFVDESFDLIKRKNEAEDDDNEVEYTHAAGIAIGKLKLLINIFPFKLVVLRNDVKSKHLAYF